MTKDQFDACYRAFCRRRPFRSFLIELTSGAQISIGHPESLRDEGQIYVSRRPDGGFVLLVADSVCRVLDSSAVAPSP